MLESTVILARCLMNMLRKLPHGALSGRTLSNPELEQVGGGMSDQGDTYQ